MQDRAWENKTCFIFIQHTKVLETCKKSAFTNPVVLKTNQPFGNQPYFLEGGPMSSFTKFMVVIQKTLTVVKLYDLSSLNSAPGGHLLERVTGVRHFLGPICPL